MFSLLFLSSSSSSSNKVDVTFLTAGWLVLLQLVVVVFIDFICSANMTPRLSHEDALIEDARPCGGDTGDSLLFFPPCLDQPFSSFSPLPPPPPPKASIVVARCASLALDELVPGDKGISFFFFFVFFSFMIFFFFFCVEE